MAKVFGIHEIELLPGVSKADFERCVAQEFIPNMGWKAGRHILPKPIAASVPGSMRSSWRLRVRRRVTAIHRETMKSVRKVSKHLLAWQRQSRSGQPSHQRYLVKAPSSPITC